MEDRGVRSVVYAGKDMLESAIRAERKKEQRASHRSAYNTDKREEGNADGPV